MSTFILYALACVAAHRLWNFEDIFRQPREWLLRRPGTKALWCQVCNAFWVCLFLGMMLPWFEQPAVRVFISTLAAYSVVRAALWLYRVAGRADDWLKLRSLSSQALPPGVTVPAAPKPAVMGTLDLAQYQPSADKKCGSCEAKKAAAQAAQTQVLAHKRRVVLLTTLSNLHPGYSVTTCVLDQARLLARVNPDWLIQIWMHENSNLSDLPEMPANVEVRQVIPQVSWRPDTVVDADRDRLIAAVRSNLIKLGNATVITHDIMFVDSYVTFAAAIHSLGKLPGFAWLHTCHSAPGVRPSRFTGGMELRYSIPDGHQLLCLNSALVKRLADYYDVPVARVSVCPNARDVTTFGNFDARAAAIVHGHSLAEADVVQTLAVSATRLRDKGVYQIVDLLAALNERGAKCRLVLVVAHANGEDAQAEIRNVRAAGVGLGLPENFLVASNEKFPDTAAQGLPQSVVRDLLSVSNLFAFPTVSEASSLALAEAALSGCLLVVNSAVPALTALIPEEFVLLSSFRWDTIDETAQRVFHALKNNKVLQAKRHVLRTYNQHAIGMVLTRIIQEDAPYTKL